MYALNFSFFSIWETGASYSRKVFSWGWRDTSRCMSSAAAVQCQKVNYNRTMSESSHKMSCEIQDCFPLYFSLIFSVCFLLIFIALANKKISVLGGKLESPVRQSARPSVQLHISCILFSGSKWIWASFQPLPRLLMHVLNWRHSKQLFQGLSQTALKSSKRNRV